MRQLLFCAAALVAACGHGNDPATGGGSSSGATTMPTSPTGSGGSAAGSGSAVAATGSDSGSGSAVATKPTPDPKTPTPPPTPPTTEGHDFTPEAKTLLAVGACGDGTVPENFSKKVLEDHCKDIKKAQENYLDKWVKPAETFFAAHEPKDIPKKVVYPFAGGDLSTALTVFPDADEITTISLEPAGDPRTLAALKGRELDAALGKVRYELNFLYRVNFSNTLNMIDAMRGGKLPTQLIFGLSALKIHGYEVVNLRYFKLNDDGSIHYLDDDDVTKAPSLSDSAEKRNRVFANVELQFRKPGGRIQIYRHMQTNLDNDHTKNDGRVLKHLESKGDIAAMTKAASYLLSWDSFSNIRDYLVKHTQWMVSDATGIAPKWGKPAGFEYETWGKFEGPHISAGNGIAKDWRTEFENEDKRDLGFRFGYYDKHSKDHLIIIKKKKS
jgi:hypothetical protein